MRVVLIGLLCKEESCMKELLERKKGLRRSILIVDDDYIAREILGRMLEDRYEVSYAENGVIALSIIKRDKLKLSLVILDLHMPEAHTCDRADLRKGRRGGKPEDRCSGFYYKTL